MQLHVKKSEITEIDAMRYLSGKNCIPDPYVVVMICHEVDIRHVKHQVSVLGVLSEKVKVALLYAGEILCSY